MLLEVVIKSVMAGQQCVNRFNYVGSGTPAAVSASFGLASAMGFIAGGEPPVFPTETIFHAIRLITANNVEFNEVIAADVYSLTDFYTTAFPNDTNGLDGTGLAQNTFTAAGLRTNVVRRDVARGTKRFVGIPDGWTGPNNALNPSYIELIQDLGDKMSAPITYDDEGNTLTFTPCIVSRLQYTTPSGKKAYKYYPTLSEQMTHVAQGIHWEAYDTPRTQVSRQIGKGK